MEADVPVHGTLGGDISKCPYYAAKMGTRPTRPAGLVFGCSAFLLHLPFASLCGSCVWWNGVPRSACDGRPPAPDGTGPVRHLVRGAGWTSGVVSDVSRPSCTLGGDALRSSFSTPSRQTLADRKWDAAPLFVHLDRSSSFSSCHWSLLPPLCRPCPRSHAQTVPQFPVELPLTLDCSGPGRASTRANVNRDPGALKVVHKRKHTMHMLSGLPLTWRLIVNRGGLRSEIITRSFLMESIS